MNTRRSGSRHIFESSLELKCLLSFGVALVIVISISFWLYYRISKSQLDTQNPLMGQLLAEREFLLMHFRVVLQQESEGAGTGEGESELNDFVSSMALQSERISGESNRVRFENRLIKATEKQSLNDFEEDLIRQWQPLPSTGVKNASATIAERIDENGHYNYYSALRLERACVNCHAVMGNESAPLGSLLGIIHVTIPEPPASKEITRLWALLLGATIITTFLALIAFYIVIRLVVMRPLRNLREVSEAISQGDQSKRAELHTGDEFEALGLAFNQMLHHLVDTQEELQSSNEELESKVDELAQRNLQLLEMNQIKSDFLATMSHELRTPLNSILGFSEVLESIKSLDEKQKRYVTNINQSGRSLLGMINDILDMAKIEAGRFEIRPVEFEIKSLIDSLCDMARPLADKKNIDIICPVAADYPPLYQDASRIQQILNNLISNAIKFTPEGGRIEIRAIQLENNCLELRVIDSGVGISDEDKQIIFKKFRQGHSKMSEGAITREHSGSGLGLSIVKELCKLLEGEVAVESQPGVGATFIVTLPWELNRSYRSEPAMTAEINKFTAAATRRLGVRG